MQLDDALAAVPLPEGARLDLHKDARGWTAFVHIQVGDWWLPGLGSDIRSARRAIDKALDDLPVADAA